MNLGVFMEQRSLFLPACPLYSPGFVLSPSLSGWFGRYVPLEDQILSRGAECLGSRLTGQTGAASDY